MNFNSELFYINGQWVKPHGEGFLDVIHSHSEAIMCRVPKGDAVDAEHAVQAASEALDAWSQLTVEQRCVYLDKIQAGLNARQDEIAGLITGEVGMPFKMAKMVQVGTPIYHWGNYGKIARRFEWQKSVGNSLVCREPVGVVVAITPWNFPLNQITLKVAPALAAGCTVVLKPSEVAPINAFILAQVIEQAGLPKGVFNLVTGLGPEIGEALVAHPKVDMVSFTGSTGAGKRIAAVAAQTVKRVTLELGGKSASVILDDADLEQAVKGTINACMLNSGQTCSAHTRMLVHISQFEQAKHFAQQAITKFTVGDPTGDSKLGPLVSKIQQLRVQAYIQKGIDEGCELLAGGLTPPLEHGFYVAPTIFATHNANATVAMEEIFGPVLTMISYQDDDDAIRIANGTPYGLGGGVWGSEARALAIAKRMRTGQVDINGGMFNVNAPFGGYKQSGYGRENGVYGLEEYLQYKSLQFKATSA